MGKQIVKKILFINTVCYGSTGQICKDLYELAEKRGYNCCIAFGRGECDDKYNSIRIGNDLDVYKSVLMTRLFDNHGFSNKKSTIQFLNQIEQFDPDIIHLHNIHGYYLNIQILFNYLKTSRAKIVWTFHDCWPFTGHCVHFLSNHCYKWKNKCYDCKFHKEYPGSYMDRSEFNFKEKKKLFTLIKNKTTIIAVSDWLKNELSESFFKDFNIKTIKNGIDLEIFHYRNSDFKEKYALLNKKVLLGVASVWTEKKGLNDFYYLSNLLDESFKIVLVGLNKKQIKFVEKKYKNILCIERTKNAVQLAEIYSSADVFLNFTKEESFGLVNYEAQACGVSVLTYDSGGTKETLFNSGSKVINNDLYSIKYILEHEEFKKDMSTMNINLIDKSNTFLKYLTLYDSL